MWRTRLVKTRRGCFEVFSAGEGPPLGVSHLYSEFNASGDLFAAAFRELRTVYLVNLRGAGGSDSAKAASELSMDAAAEDLEAIREALGFGSWDFAGHSTGGMLGLLYAVTRGEGIRSLVAAGAAASHRYADAAHCIYSPQHPDFQRMQDLIEALKVPELTQAERNRLSKERTKLSLLRPERYAEYFPAEVRKRISVPRLDYYGREDFPRFDLLDQLRRCPVPTLVGCGRHDVQCPVECSEEIAAAMPHARLVIFEGSSHYPFLEEPRAFRAAAQEFLSHRSS